MKKITLESEKIDRLREYYSDKKLIILGANDLKSLGGESLEVKNKLLKYMKNILSTEDVEPIIFDCFSNIYNRLEHLDYFLTHNLSLRDNTLLQENSLLSLYNSLTIREQNNIYLSTSLKESKEPLVIYSSGFSSLMNESCISEDILRKGYNLRKNREYFCSLDKIKNPRTCNKIIGGIERNLENIYTLNGKSDIYVLGYDLVEDKNLPYDLKCIIEHYNEKIMELCKQYNVTYIDNQLLKDEFSYKYVGYLFSLLNYIIDDLYKKKISKDIIYPKNAKIVSLEVGSKGTCGIYDSISSEYNKDRRDLELSEGYSKELINRRMNILDKELKVMKRVINKR
ncbi:MAG: hypothetical protein PHQ64_02550 [Bacilli bacterium]|nr:hypothetical protein [Bacilli bacterium]